MAETSQCCNVPEYPIFYQQKGGSGGVFPEIKKRKILLLTSIKSFQESIRRTNQIQWAGT